MAHKGRSTDVSGAARIIKQDALTGAPLVGGTCRALCVGTAGTATFIDADGNICTDYPLQVGYNPIQVQQITTLTTAANVWALW